MRRKHQTRRAIPALQAVSIAESLLDGMKLAVSFQPFYRCDLRAVGLNSKNGKRNHSHDDQKHRTRTTKRKEEEKEREREKERKEQKKQHTTETNRATETHAQ